MSQWDFIIVARTRAELIADGDLVEIPWMVSNPAGLKLPVAFTRAAWDAVMDGIGAERWPTEADALVETFLEERTNRILTTAVKAVTDAPHRRRRVAFDVPLYGVTLLLQVSRGDDGEPAFTVLTPDEG
ncbi:DUF6573 family protein [Streptomyces cinnamoneus]|uniref:DUF6573 family protein n=1 Tax=Streptomyces cinnamoneus TaxID=53446 RepID=UPI00340231D7